MSRRKRAAIASAKKVDSTTKQAAKEAEAIAKQEAKQTKQAAKRHDVHQELMTMASQGIKWRQAYEKTNAKRYWDKVEIEAVKADYEHEAGLHGHFEPD